MYVITSYKKINQVNWLDLKEYHHDLPIVQKK